jgi:hypothetical protein
VQLRLGDDVAISAGDMKTLLTRLSVTLPKRSYDGLDAQRSCGTTPGDLTVSQRPEEGWSALEKMHFYNVRSLLVRRWVPAQRRKALEAWTGDGWTTYPDMDSVLRHGARLSAVEAFALLCETRERQHTLPPLSSEEALVALRSRLRRA